MTEWTVHADPEAVKRAYACSRGTYQDAIIRGEENLSGSTLEGKASEYSGRYKRSLEALLARMTAAGVPWHEIRGSHNKRILVIGEAAS